MAWYDRRIAPPTSVRDAAGSWWPWRRRARWHEIESWQNVAITGQSLAVQPTGGPVMMRAIQPIPGCPAGLEVRACVRVCVCVCVFWAEQ